ncbi:dTDP-4-dehydrorhamnose reductase family protein [Aureimonas altamirensis]|uniref:dTDP-4-dehydrorhamnose reductase family protein n=1 Tax=Aureimonas altamirensis TaxID=370622 RepID=UPI002554B9CA|nr:SDR family oxidoreductase [Aureimonas altamirensis]
MTKILILGGSGMLGQTAFRTLAVDARYEVYASVRSAAQANSFAPNLQNRILTGIDVLDSDSVAACLADLRPDVVINCVGIVKQLQAAADPLTALPVNALLPHRLSRLCSLINARLIHISTDCVFSGLVGNYREDDKPDADDLYGRSKLLGEVCGRNAITLRTSIIGHELSSRNGILEWFLAQTDVVNGYSKAFFSGVTTLELSRVIGGLVIPNTELNGIYHVSSSRISKLDLLEIFSEVYHHRINIKAVDHVVIDRSLNSDAFRSMTGYHPPDWTAMITEMRVDGERA